MYETPHIMCLGVTTIDNIRDENSKKEKTMGVFFFNFHVWWYFLCISVMVFYFYFTVVYEHTL